MMYVTLAQRLLDRFEQDPARHVTGSIPLTANEWEHARSTPYRDRVKALVYLTGPLGERVTWTYRSGDEVNTWLWVWRMEHEGQPGYAFALGEVPVWAPASEVQEVER